MSKREDRERRKQEALKKQKDRQIWQFEEAERHRQIKSVQDAGLDVPREAKIAELPELRREAKSIEPSDSDDAKPQWCFELFDHAKDWRENEHGEHAGFCEVGQHLQSYSTMTWREIKANRHRDHPIPTGSLCSAAKKRLEYIQQDDADELWRFRFGAKQRIWGIKNGHVLRVIWWDPDHQIYPTAPKNT